MVDYGDLSSSILFLLVCLSVRVMCVVVFFFELDLLMILSVFLWCSVNDMLLIVVFSLLLGEMNCFMRFWVFSIGFLFIFDEGWVMCRFGMVCFCGVRCLLWVCLLGMVLIRFCVYVCCGVLSICVVVFCLIILFLCIMRMLLVSCVMMERLWLMRMMDVLCVFVFFSSESICVCMVMLRVVVGLFVMMILGLRVIVEVIRVCCCSLLDSLFGCCCVWSLGCGMLMFVSSLIVF